MVVSRSGLGASSDPHGAGPVLTAGPKPEDAGATLILVHGRGSSAREILSLHAALGVEGLAAMAPQAAGNTWYPYSFLAPVEMNQPGLGSGLRRIESLVVDLLARGVPSERIALLGFSQGACLAAEFAAHHPRRYGGVMVLCGGLIGLSSPLAPADELREYGGSLEGTPVFLGAVDPDPHVPLERVLETERVLARMGAAVEYRRYPGMPHAINADQLEVCRGMVRRLVAAGGKAAHGQGAPG